MSQTSRAPSEAAGSEPLTVGDLMLALGDSAAFSGRELELTWVRRGDIHPSPAGHREIADVYLEACGWRAD